ncbi:uncharacterized protein RHIMIDRAFT_293656 [Rhizopus microsporus ATCC 52813]|uniref:Uncharacterized protein n=1 Tax=Rhizopus microsporus ATCC 52813 TaxID=1340429 RepID=A0A2G4SNA5_RHIZD|nr:uncharacterized protein RHIMIDRAFT_293656 [Rhizopus microsporus ATCC 52813]PHZ10267.1 hypothetical protein RHIMIDRAFT_293656 [Rhizopus microsporus ATCC 52813]
MDTVTDMIIITGITIHTIQLFLLLHLWLITIINIILTEHQLATTMVHQLIMVHLILPTCTEHHTPMAMEVIILLVILSEHTFKYNSQFIYHFPHVMLKNIVYITEYFMT